MATNFEKLQTLLSELFQLDQADLDFGIYRIMNQKRDEITRFLAKDLLPQVKTAFAQYHPVDRANLEAELADAVGKAKELGIDPEQTKLVKEIRERISHFSVDTVALENEVYSHLYSFFRRYYDNGDFISMRRYKEGVYAIPYEGEEVKLHWANADQYYIKTSEYFRDYSFKLPSGRLAHFKIIEADTEKDNVKAADDKERRFILAEETPAEVEDGELVIRFEYRSDEGKRRQDAINNQTITDIQENIPADWAADLAALAPTASNPRRTLLEKRLNDYTARNTFDYFIHKDLGGFLRRELDFYIKNEVMRLDDIEDETAPRVEQYLSKIKVLRQIAHKIIAFLAQTEDFQKKLWLKKKFVMETNYCITLDRVPEELYPQICANDAQREEWVGLFAIDEIKANLLKPGYSKPLTVEFLKTNPFLVLDTRFFDQAFTARLIVTIDNFDIQCNGILVYSENFQAINLIGKRYKANIDCIYVDPPYNTDAASIMYKNGYKVSSWNSLISERLQSSFPTLKEEGILCITIDDFQQKELHGIIEQNFGAEAILGTVVIRNNPSGRPIPTGFAIAHEYAIFAARNAGVKIGKLPRSEQQNQRYKETDKVSSFMWELLRKRGSNSRREDAKKSYFPFYVGESSIRLPEMSWDENQESWIVQEKPKPGEKVVYPIDENGVERNWRWGIDTARNNVNELKVESKNGSVVVYYKFRQPEGATPTTIWIDSRYSATEHGTGLVKHFFKEYQPFSYPKSIFAVEDCISVSGMRSNHNGVCFDFFAGSGTTGHAVINLNRHDEGNRKYILVEMGDYFDTVLKPRIQKVIYSTDWKDGKPISRQGSSHCFKYLRLESYEDTLNNLYLRRSEEQQMALDEATPAFRESYMLSYGMDVESKDCLLNLRHFVHPFHYQLNIATGTVGETRSTPVDMVETFNYLIGLRVETIQTLRGFKVVTGRNPANERTLIIWRDLEDKSNADLEAFFRKQDYNPRDMEFDLIYVNGDNNLENLRRPDETWKVRLIEEEFLRLMFEGN